MSRAAPKFVVGEEVLYDAMHSQTGEIVGGEGFILYSHEHPIWRFIYGISGLHYQIAEDCLRKKPRPADQSFDELMRDLQRPREVVA